MGFLHCLLIILQLAMVIVVVESSFVKTEARFDLDSLNSHAFRTCNGLVGDCIDEAEEIMLDSESNRRILAQARYISYDAMHKDSIPCNRRGASYYNCAGHQQVNPYSRGCTQISRCPRNTR